LDIYTSKTRTCDTAPLFVYYHGGTWVAGTRDKIRQRYRNDVVAALVDSGCVVVSVDYRLVAEEGATLVESLHDCHTALDFVRQNPHLFGNDNGCRPIVLWGSSSGAQMALMTAYNDTVTGPGRVECLVDDFGPMNLVTALNQCPDWGKVRLSPMFFGTKAHDISQFDSLARVFSPLYHINHRIPVMIYHGLDDDVVLPEQSYALRDSLDSDMCDMVLFEGNGHGLHSMDDSLINLYIASLWNFLYSHIDARHAK